MVPVPGPVLLVFERIGSFTTDITDGVEAVVAPAGVPLLVHLWDQDTNGPPAPLVRALDHLNPRGIMIAPLVLRDTQEQMQRLLDARPHLRCVYVCCGGGSGMQVRGDNPTGMRLIVQHLVLERGVRRILVVRGLPDHPDSVEREEAVRAELARLGMPESDYRVVTGLFNREPAQRVVRAALEEDPQIDAIVAFNDRSALGALDAASAVGRSVGQDLLVTGFDDEDYAAFSEPPLTTVSQDTQEMGRTAARLLLDPGAEEGPHEIRLPVALRRRASTDSGASQSPSPGVAARLWRHVATLNLLDSLSQGLMACQTIEEITEVMSSELPMLGANRAFLVLRTEDAGPARGLVTLSYFDGVVHDVSREEPFDLTDCLPSHLRSQLEHGTLIIQPLDFENTEIGYLLIDLPLHGMNFAGAMLRMDLSRTIDTIRRSARLAERTRELEIRTRQLETEVAARTEAQLALAHQATHDPLTGLPVRSLFLADGDRLLEGNQSRATVLIIDLDRFRDVNDTLGHHLGDELLAEAATRLVTLAHDQGFVCRLGADQFGVLVPEVADPQESMAVAHRVLTVLRQQFQLAGLTIEIDASVGVACAPLHATDAATLLRLADAAMHVAKSERSGTALYAQHHLEARPNRLTLFSDLRRALSEGELVAHYQPVVDIAAGRVTGVEALVRWNHPDRGLIPPSEFLDFAETTGLIHPLTTYMLDRALTDCRRWRDQGIPLTVAVNLSTRRLTDDDLPLQTAELLARHGLPTSSLVFEVTETAAMDDPDRAFCVMRDLRQLGIGLALDDFGTGYASLAYLSRLPVDTLKIDRSFVGTMESDAANLTIVRSTLDLARSLGLGVVAEGIETRSAYQLLSSVGCQEAQGYWLARPGPADTLPKAMAEIRGRLADEPVPPHDRRAGGRARSAVTGIPQPRGATAAPVTSPTSTARQDAPHA